MSSLWESRRSKKRNEENKKIKTSGRDVWSEEDELSLLKAMIDYEVTQQSNPYDDMGKFLDFVKPLICFDVQRKQLTDKLWKLKNKFLENEKKGKLLSSDDRNGKLVKCSKKKGNSQNGEQENVAIDDDVLNECLKLGKKKRKHLSRDDQNDEEVNVVLDDVDGQNDIEGNVLNKCLKVVEKKRKHLSRDGENDNCQNVVNSDGQNVRGDNVVVSDVDVDKSSKVVKNKGKGKVVENKGKGKDVTCDGRNVEQDNVAIEVNRKDLKEFTSMFPELTNMLELETLSRMPQHIKSKCVIDTINSMGWEKANELEEEWVDIHLMEMELKAKKLDLKSKEINLILEATHKKFRP